MSLKKSVTALVMTLALSAVARGPGGGQLVRRDTCHGGFEQIVRTGGRRPEIIGPGPADRPSVGALLRARAPHIIGPGAEFEPDAREDATAAPECRLATPGEPDDL
ncbi:MAG: hypothetical protein ACR2L2_08690 [Acidobacteriota bacterium]